MTEQKDDNKINNNTKKERLLNIAIAVLSALLVLVVVYSLFFDTVRVLQTSMLPTIESGSYVFIRKTHDVKRGDIVVFKDDSIEKNMLIKRVVAIGGDTISIAEDGILRIKYIDEKGEEALIEYDEPYIKDGENIIIPETYIPIGYVYLLGDNRIVSLDSSEFGAVLQNKIIGKMLFVFGK